MKKLSENEKWFKVSLRLSGDALPIDDMKKKLGIEPSFVGKMGEHIDGNLKYAKHQTNVWGYSFTEDSTITFEQQIGDLLNILEPKKSVLYDLLSISGVEGELFLGFSSGNGQGGGYFSAQLLGRISALRLSILLDLYPNI